FADAILDRDQPEFWDLFGRLEWSPSERQTARLHALVGGDRLDLVEEGGGESKLVATAYDSGYLWATHQAIASDRLYVDSAVSLSRGERDRRATERDDEKAIDVVDLRESRVAGFQQTWSAQLATVHAVELGFAARRFETDYDYFSARDFSTPLVVLRAEPRGGESSFRGVLEDDQYGLFASERWQPSPALAVELGLRYDDHSLADDRVWSPRLQLSWALGERGVVRAGWGHYHQSQRSYELLVEDGDTAIYPLERSEHRVLGYEHRFDRGPLSALRVEAYRRSVRDPRPRYESLLEPFDAFPEGEVDRYRFDPTSSLARGAELFVRGRPGERLGWWLNYAWAKSEDEIDGKTVPRLIDQRHTLNVDLQLRLPREWSLNLAWIFHTGRPTTAVGVEPIVIDDGGGDGGDGGEEGDDDEGGGDGGGSEPTIEYVPVLGPLNGERLADYHRLDLRIAREWRLERGRLTFYADVQNLYDRENAAGYSIELDAETGELTSTPELWPGIFASAGVTWEF
ncbi:MAG TPA: TonB-dependent receptor, partial [Thermoanaerobaculia bacterium]|nr:TonB-dependent receptor [Thermoanaerobaculia bacterium]